MDIQKAIDVMKNEVECVRRNDGKNCNRECGKCELLKESSEILEAYHVAISGLKELEQYRQIGTAEECRAAREKSKRKKTELNRSGEYICPVCRRLVTKYYDLHCSWCGQALDWSESEDVQ